jgi:hypothetical protein
MRTEDEIRERLRVWERIRKAEEKARRYDRSHMARVVCLELRWVLGEG